MSKLSRQHLIDAVEDMKNLKEGWFDSIGEPISYEAIKSAKEFISSFDNKLKFYSISPTVEGGILLEFKNGNWDSGVEFNSNDTISYFGVEILGEGKFIKNCKINELTQLINSQ